MNGCHPANGHLASTTLLVLLLLFQMVHNGLSKAPVGRVSKLLEVLRTSQQQAGGRFVNHYANVSRSTVAQL